MSASTHECSESCPFLRQAGAGWVCTLTGAAGAGGGDDWDSVRASFVGVMTRLLFSAARAQHDVRRRQSASAGLRKDIERRFASKRARRVDPYGSVCSIMHSGKADIVSAVSVEQGDVDVYANRFYGFYVACQAQGPPSAGVSATGRRCDLEYTALVFLYWTASAHGLVHKGLTILPPDGRMRTDLPPQNTLSAFGFEPGKYTSQKWAVNERVARLYASGRLEELAPF